MIVQCVKCSTRFRIGDDRITDRGTKVRCSRCAHVFLVRKEAEEETVATPQFRPQSASQPPRARQGGSLLEEFGLSGMGEALEPPEPEGLGSAIPTQSPTDVATRLLRVPSVVPAAPASGSQSQRPARADRWSGDFGTLASGEADPSLKGDLPGLTDDWGLPPPAQMSRKVDSSPPTNDPYAALGFTGPPPPASTELDARRAGRPSKSIQAAGEAPTHFLFPPAAAPSGRPEDASHHNLDANTGMVSLRSGSVDMLHDSHSGITGQTPPFPSSAPRQAEAHSTPPGSLSGHGSLSGMQPRYRPDPELPQQSSTMPGLAANSSAFSADDHSGAFEAFETASHSTSDSRSRPSILPQGATDNDPFADMELDGNSQSQSYQMGADEVTPYVPAPDSSDIFTEGDSLSSQLSSLTGTGSHHATFNKTTVLPPPASLISESKGEEYRIPQSRSEFSLPKLAEALGTLVGIAAAVFLFLWFRGWSVDTIKHARLVEILRSTPVDDLDPSSFLGVAPRGTRARRYATQDGKSALVVFGEVENRTATPISSVEVVATIRDGEQVVAEQAILVGVVVDEEALYLGQAKTSSAVAGAGVIGAHGAAPFSVVFFGVQNQRLDGSVHVAFRRAELAASAKAATSETPSSDP